MFEPCIAAIAGFLQLCNRILQKRICSEELVQKEFAYLREQNLFFNPIALRKAKTPWSFDCSECNRVKSIQTNTAIQKLSPFLMFPYTSDLFINHH